MRTNPAKEPVSVTRWHRDLLLVTSVLTYLLIALGGVVCVMDASRGCPDWPACYGRLLPPMRLDSILEYSHRVLAALTSLFIIASAIVGWRKARPLCWVSRPPLISFFFLLAVAGFGAMVVLRGLEPGLAALDLGSALIVLALVLSATVTASLVHQKPAHTGRVSFGSASARWILLTLLAVFLVLVSGVLVAADGSVVRCLSWPLFAGALDLGDLRGWLGLARRLLAGVTAILVIATVVRAWREKGAVRAVGATVGALFLVELGLGAFRLVFPDAIPLQLLHVATAAAFWALLVVLTMLVGLTLPASPE